MRTISVQPLFVSAHINLFCYISAAAIRPEAFAAQPSLERIDLRYNRISGLDGGSFAGLTAPKEIYLTGNRLIQLNSDVFEVLFAVVAVWMLCAYCD